VGFCSRTIHLSSAYWPFRHNITEPIANYSGCATLHNQKGSAWTGASHMSVTFPTLNSAVCRHAVLTSLATIGLIYCSTALGHSHIFTTEVREVRSSTVDGHNVLTLEITQLAGPTACRGSTLLVQRTDAYPTVPDADFEAIALHAMLSSESLVLSVPTDLHSCIDGKPMVTDMWLMSYE